MRLSSMGYRPARGEFINSVPSVLFRTLALTLANALATATLTTKGKYLKKIVGRQLIELRKVKIRIMKI